MINPFKSRTTHLLVCFPFWCIRESDSKTVKDWTQIFLGEREESAWQPWLCSSPDASHPRQLKLFAAVIAAAHVLGKKSEGLGKLPGDQSWANISISERGFISQSQMTWTITPNHVLKHLLNSIISMYLEKGTLTRGQLKGHQIQFEASHFYIVY